MTGEHLGLILKEAHAKSDKSGWESLPEGTLLTLYMAHDGASLTVNRIVAVRQDGELLYARTPKKDTFALSRSDLFAVAIEGANADPTRRAGFG